MIHGRTLLSIGMASLLILGWAGIASADYAGGYDLYKKGDYQNALMALGEVGMDQADYPTAVYLKGLCYAKLGKYEEAKQEYQKAIELRADYGKAYTNLARALLQLKDDQGAMDAAKKGAELEGDSGAYNVLGLTQMRMKKFDDAMAAFSKAIQLDPKNAWPHNNKGIALLRKFQDSQKDIAAEALELFKKAVEIQPENPVFIKNKEFAESLLAM